MTFRSHGSSVHVLVSSTTFVHHSWPDSHIFTKYCCNSFYKCHLYTNHLYPLLPHLQGWAGIMIFTFQSPGISPALWRQAFGNNPALCPTLHNRKSQRGKRPNVITPTLPRHCGNNQKVIVWHLTPATPRLSPSVGAVDTNDRCIILLKYCMNK